MLKRLEITAEGTLHKIRDPEGASFRFVTKGSELLTSAVIFQEGMELDDASIARYKNSKITVIIETDEENKDFSIP